MKVHKNFEVSVEPTPTNQLIELYKQGYQLDIKTYNIQSLAVEPELICSAAYAFKGQSITVTVKNPNNLGGTPPYNYTWKIVDPDGITNTSFLDQSSIKYTVNKLGLYFAYVTITDSAILFKTTWNANCGTYSTSKTPFYAAGTVIVGLAAILAGGYYLMKKKPESCTEPDIDINFDELTNDYGEVVDWLGATVTIDFPQKDCGTYTCSIPGSVISKAAEKESINPISSYISQYCQYNNVKLSKSYIEDQLESRILSDITGIKERQAEATACSPAVIDKYTKARDRIKKSNAEIERIEGEQSEWRLELDILESQEETINTIDKIKTAERELARIETRLERSLRTISASETEMETIREDCPTIEELI